MQFSEHIHKKSFGFSTFNINIFQHIDNQQFACKLFLSNIDAIIKNYSNFAHQF
jgi:hypothetical protein